MELEFIHKLSNSIKTLQHENTQLKDELSTAMYHNTLTCICRIYNTNITEIVFTHSAMFTLKLRFAISQTVHKIQKHPFVFSTDGSVGIESNGTIRLYHNLAEFAKDLFEADLDCLTPPLYP